MGNNITLTASDGFKLGGYRAEPQGKPKGGLVVIQEIFGVNHHIRACATASRRRLRVDRAGGVRSHPAQFRMRLHARRDRARAQAHPEDRLGRACCATPPPRSTTSRAPARSASSATAWAARVAFLSAGKLDGLVRRGRLLRRPDRQERRPQAESADPAAFRRPGPVDPDVGRRDLIKQKRSDCDIYVYQGAGHGFSCDERGSYDEAAHKQARDRTLAWFGKYVG